MEGERTMTDARPPSDVERELADLRARCADLEAQLGDLAAEAGEAAEAIRRAFEMERTALTRAAAAQATIASVRAGNAGRLADAYGRWRLRVRNRRQDQRLRAWRRRAGQRTWSVPPAVSAAPMGVNVAGYIDAESGMGEATRSSIRALGHAGIPIALNNVAGPQRMLDSSFTDFTDANPHPFNLVHLNADNMDWFASTRGAAYFQDRYTIGFWFWELEAFRPDWLPAFDRVDEVWVASDHVRRSVGEDASVPVVRMPLAIPALEPLPVGRAHFGLPSDAFAFLYTFDVSSQIARKNPIGAIRAFRLAALAPEAAVLVLKFTNGHTNPDAVRQLAEAAEGLNVKMIDGAIDRRDLTSLMQATDCCVSLHRAEGFGLTLAEQMSLGKPAIATAYSGNLDFMTPEVSRLIPARMIEIERDCGPYLSGFRWADPDLDSAAAAMRDLALAPEAARALGARGRAHVLDVLSLDRAAAAIRSRLDGIRQGHRQPTDDASGRDASAPARDAHV